MEWQALCNSLVYSLSGTLRRCVVIDMSLYNADFRLKMSVEFLKLSSCSSKVMRSNQNTNHDNEWLTRWSEMMGKTLLFTASLLLCCWSVCAQQGNWVPANSMSFSLKDSITTVAVEANLNVSENVNYAMKNDLAQLFLEVMYSDRQENNQQDKTLN